MKKWFTVKYWKMMNKYCWEDLFLLFSFDFCSLHSPLFFWEMHTTPVERFWSVFLCQGTPGMRVSSRRCRGADLTFVGRCDRMSYAIYAFCRWSNKYLMLQHLFTLGLLRFFAHTYHKHLLFFVRPIRRQTNSLGKEQVPSFGCYMVLQYRNVYNWLETVGNHVFCKRCHLNILPQFL